MGIKEVDIWSDAPDEAPEPEKTRRKRGRPPSEKLYTIALKKNAVGWKLFIAEVPESTIRNHTVDIYEPDIFDMVVARVESLMRRLVTG